MIKVDIEKITKKERELSELTLGVMKIVMNELKKRGLYTEFRKYYSRWALPQETRFNPLEPYMTVLISTFSPRVVIRESEISTIWTQLYAAASIVDSFSWSSTGKDGYARYSPVHNYCQEKAKEYLATKAIKKKIENYDKKYLGKNA